MGAELRLPEARLSGFVYIGFPHACLARRVVIGSVDASNSPEYFTDPLVLLEDDANFGTTRGTKLTMKQVRVFPFWSVVKFSCFPLMELLEEVGPTDTLGRETRQHVLP